MNKEENTKDSKYNFYALTPVDDAKISVYESALNFVFTHDNVRNVALSGSYGSGKSSVIASYKKQHSDKKFMHISLAHFHSTSINKDKAVSNGEVLTEAVLEGKILNQLIHQIPHGEIPLTNFRIKRESSKKQNIFTVLLLGIGIVLGLYAFMFEKWTTLAQALTVSWLKNISDLSLHQEGRLIAGLIVFVIFVYQLVELMERRYFIKKADVSGLEIEIFDDSNESFFDKYLNEVLYLFRKAEVDVIVFEDIDRFDSSGIFERLHEVNTLVNNDRKGAPLRFFYLMRDDIFESKDRTKFFDFIIPIIPVVDGSNSLDILIERFKESGLIDGDKSMPRFEFLEELSLYIDDMRILLNICNEFQVYHGRLSTTEQDPNKMLALIAFKNLFPRDFADLQSRCGFMFEIIGGNGKDGLISTEKERLQKYIEDKTAELTATKKETLFSEEIPYVYINKLADALPNHGISRNGQNSKMYFDSFRDNQYTQQIVAEYDRRMQHAHANDAERYRLISSLEKDITAARDQLAALEGRKLKELITRANIDDLFKAKFTSETGQEEGFNSIKDSLYFALLKFLVREGYIDETYSDYMTYFHEKSLSRNDKIFLRSVTDKKSKDAAYSIDNPSMVASRLPLAYFHQEETLNYALFDFLISDLLSERAFADKTRKLIRQISDNGYFDFVIAYSKQKEDISSLVQAFGEAWTSFISDVSGALDIGKNQSKTESNYYLFVKKYAYSLFALIGEENAGIGHLDDSSLSTLVDFVSNDAEFLSCEKCNAKNVAIGLKLCKVSFSAINAETATRELLEKVYLDSLYIINSGNIETMMNAFYQATIPDRGALRTANYSAIMAESESPLATYVNDNIENYLTAVLAECGETITDTRESVISLLNNTDIETSQKIEYISYLQTTITSILDINDNTLWTELLKSRVAVEYSAANVVAYFRQHCTDGFDDTLIEYINSNGTDINFNDCFGSDEERNLFFRATVTSVSLNNHIYKGYLEQFSFRYGSFGIDGIPHDKLSILDELEIIKMSAGSLKFIREHYGDYLLTFAENHISDYIQIVSDSTSYIREEVLGLLNTKIKDSDKILLLKLDTTPVSVQGEKYSDTVTAHILQNNYDAGDFNHLIESYSSFGEQVQAVIFDIATKYIENAFSVLTAVDRQLLSALFISDKITLNYKETMFKILAPHASDTEIKQWLPYASSENFLALYEKNKRPKYDNTEWNKNILEIFKARGLIEDFKLEESDQKYTIVRGKKQIKIEED